MVFLFICERDKVDMYSAYRKKTFLVILFMMSVIGLCLSGAAYYGRQWLISTYPADNGQAFLTELVPHAIAVLTQNGFYQWVLPGVVVFFILVGLIVLTGVAVFVSGAEGKDQSVVDDKPAGKPGKKDFIDHKIEQERKRRLFLHTLSVLQREGRLLDFFDEDLSAYDDSKIGAVVRSIQEDCKKAVKKYIDPKPVVQGEEGDSITIEDGFDIDTINLVGNVSGQPPFQGVIKHPGWRAGKKDVPKLSDIQDPGIMTPAEIEIQ